MLTEKDYCDYDTCVALKELGYNVPTSAYYMPNNQTLFFVPNYFRGGFDIRDCYRSHNSLPEDAGNAHLIDSPRLYEAQEWLREEKEIYVIVIPEYNDYRPIKGVKYRLEVAHWKDEEFGYETIEWKDEGYTVSLFETYKEALLEGIKEAVKILKDYETIHE